MISPRSTCHRRRVSANPSRLLMRSNSVTFARGTGTSHTPKGEAASGFSLQDVAVHNQQSKFTEGIGWPLSAATIRRINLLVVSSACEKVRADALTGHELVAGRSVAMVGAEEAA